MQRQRTHTGTQTGNTRRLALLLSVLSGLTAADCVKKKCKYPSSAFDVEVTFESGISTHAAYLEVISEVTFSDGYKDKRMTRLVWESSFGPTKTFLVDPGSRSKDRYEEEENPEGIQTFDYKLMIRVFSSDGVLVGEGVMDKRGLPTDGCDRHSMSVSRSRTCAGKAAGEPCVGDPAQGSQGHYVCLDASTCSLSGCGDGVVDPRRGELCEPGIEGRCHDQKCLPEPLIADLGLSPNQRFSKPVVLSCAGDMSRTELGGLEPAPLRTTDDAEWRNVLWGSMVLEDLHGTYGNTMTGRGGMELAIGLPAGWTSVGGSCTGSQTEPTGRRGKFLVRNLPITGESASLTHTNAAPLGPGNLNSTFGFALAAGDLNGDGYADLAVSAPEGSSTGSGGGGFVFVYQGKRVLQDQDHFVPVNDTRIVKIECELGGNPLPRYGHALASADFNGDGYADLAVGAPRYSQSSTRKKGLVDILPGGADRFAQGQQFAIQGSGDGPYVSFRLTAEAGDTALGYALSVGNVNGDALPDLAIGAPGTASGKGAVHVVYGHGDLLQEPGASGAVPVDIVCRNDCRQHDVWGLTIAAPSTTNATRFGVGVALGDLDGDGLDEVAVTRSAPDVTGQAVVFVYKGSALPQSNEANKWQVYDGEPQLTIFGPGGSAFGFSVMIKDVNGDLQPDLVIGAPLMDVEARGLVPVRPGAGGAYVVFGSRRSPWQGVLDLSLYESGSVDLTEVDYGVVVLKGPRVASQMGIALEAGPKTVEPGDHALLMLMAGSPDAPHLATGGVMAVHLDTVFERECGNGLAELGEQCDCGQQVCREDDTSVPPFHDHLGGIDCFKLGFDYDPMPTDATPLPTCSNDCLMVETPCETADATDPCTNSSNRLLDVTEHCNKWTQRGLQYTWVTCQDLGYTSGDITCNDASCLYDFSGCH